MLDPPALIGCVAQTVVAGRREIEDEPAVAVWLASGLPAEAFGLDFVRTSSGGLAGFFAAGEIGPVAGRNALHAFTASMAVFVDGTT